jgi:hypothetical protein
MTTLRGRRELIARQKSFKEHIGNVNQSHPPSHLERVASAAAQAEAMVAVAPTVVGPIRGLVGAHVEKPPRITSLFI